MSDLKQEAQDLANKIEYAIKTEGEITLFQPNGTRAAYALRRLAESDTALTRIRELERVADRIKAKIAQLIEYRENCQIEHAMACAEGRLMQARMDLMWLTDALSSKDQEKTNG